MENNKKETGETLIMIKRLLVELQKETEAKIFELNRTGISLILPIINSRRKKPLVKRKEEIKAGINCIDKLLRKNYPEIWKAQG